MAHLSNTSFYITVTFPLKRLTFIPFISTLLSSIFTTKNWVPFFSYPSAMPQKIMRASISIPSEKLENLVS